jgi:hypothetical protein
MTIKKRDFLAASIGLGAGLGLIGNALAQTEHEAGPGRRQIPRRKAKTTPLFKAPTTSGGGPAGWPNSIALAPEGVWVGEQRHDGKPEAAWLMDWNGKLLKTVMTQSKDTSGIAYGGGYIWMGANTPKVNGIFQTDMDSKLIAIHQIPLGPKDNGGSCHGAFWHEGKIWIVANRLRSIIRVDAKTWEPEYAIPIILPPETPRFHGIAWDNGAIWIVIGNNSKNYAESTPGVAKLDAETGQILEIVDFLPGSCDPHGLAMRNGVLISCDAGEHPGWPISTGTVEISHSTSGGNSPFGGSIFRIDPI